MVSFLKRPHTLGKNSPADAAEDRLLTGFVAVSDKALREYKAGRECLGNLYSKSANQMHLMDR